MSPLDRKRDGVPDANRNSDGLTLNQADWNSKTRPDANKHRYLRKGTSMIPAVKAKLLEGKRGLIVGIANDQSIAWGCAKAFRAFGADLAVTYLNDKAKKYVAPLARELEASIFMPLDVNIAGQMEAVFERITKEWGKLDFVV